MDKNINNFKNKYANKNIFNRNKTNIIKAIDRLVKDKKKFYRLIKDIKR